MSLEPQLLTVSQTAQVLAVSRSTVYRLIDEGRLSTVTIRSTMRIRPNDIKRFLDEQQRIQHERTVRFQ